MRDQNNVPLGFVSLTEIDYVYGESKGTEVAKIIDRKESVALIDINLLASASTNMHGDRVVSLRPTKENTHGQVFIVAESGDQIGRLVRDAQQLVARRMEELRLKSMEQLELEKEVLLLRKEEAAREKKNS